MPGVKVPGWRGWPSSPPWGSSPCTSSGSSRRSPAGSVRGLRDRVPALPVPSSAGSRECPGRNAPSWPSSGSSSASFPGSPPGSHTGAGPRLRDPLCPVLPPHLRDLQGAEVRGILAKIGDIRENPAPAWIAPRRARTPGHLASFCVPFIPRSIGEPGDGTHRREFQNLYSCTEGLSVGYPLRAICEERDAPGLPPPAPGPGFPEQVPKEFD